MEQMKNYLSTNKAWELLIDKYDIVNKIKNDGLFCIDASKINEYKEARLMAKWDSSKSLPEALKNNKINILPISRNTYVMGDFMLYHDIPKLDEKVEKMVHVEIPDYESIDINNITSEATAINVLNLSGILDDFLGTNKNALTFNGRMVTGIFDFDVDTFRKIKRKIHVNNAQCEIDGGFENDSSVVILEAKNIVYDDFHIRQLYYPYRLWKTKVSKPIRLVFSIYSNQIYRLFEYRFNNPEDYSSIELINYKNYSLQDTEISLDELAYIRKTTEIIADDNMDNANIPFIQANSMDRVINLLEKLYHNPMTKLSIAELMAFDPRQSDYYFNAGKYLGIFEKTRIHNTTNIKLTALGEKIYRLKYKERQLKLVSLILGHKIFAYLFDLTLEYGELPNMTEIIKVMIEFKVCNTPQIERRAGSVYGWLKWIFNLTKI